MSDDKTILEQLDPDVRERMAGRRDMLAKFGRLAALSIPVAAGLQARAAFGQALPQQVIDTLNFALTLEYLEDEYYRTGLETSGLIPAATADVYQQISTHEAAHVALLESVLGDNAVEKPTFDFTAGGTFDPFTNYQTFLALSQGFEDTGVRAYKGQAANLMDSPDILTTALQIHSVEARHAAQVRRLRGPGSAMPDAWIAFDNTNVSALEPVYAGEENTTHAGIDVATLTDKSDEAVTEAFDEPLTKEQVLAIANMFIES